MKTNFTTVDEYLSSIAIEFSAPFNKLRETILSAIPQGFVEQVSYGMIGYVVPHEIYPKGYHCNPKLPLPFINLAAQKNYIALYHMGIYADPESLKWFVNEFPKHNSSKLDMGKSCIRFKKKDQIPFELIAQLVKKTTVADWIALYESQINTSK